MKLAAGFAALSIASCAPARALPADPSAALDPIAFFLGRSEGEGSLRTLLSKPVRISVRSIGSRRGDGSLVLDQTIREGAKAPRVRRWVMRPLGGGRFTGSLTDAVGPVAVEAKGPRATIRYRMKNGLAVTQQLALQRGGRTVLNRLAVTKFGVRVATLEEMIRKLD